MVKAPVSEFDVIFVVFEKGVHGEPPAWSHTWKFMPVNASSFMADRRPPAKSFQDLLVWRKAHDLVLAVYLLTADFPRQETYGLSLQMRERRSRFRPTSPKVSAGAANQKKRGF